MCLELTSKTPASAAQPTTTEFPFKKGDKVRVLRKAASHENGWRNAWTAEMNDAVGKTGTVLFVIPQDLDVTVEISGIGHNFGYPVFVLELVKDTPAPAETQLRFTVGQRVIIKYGDPGVVTGFRDGFIRVQRDNGGGSEAGWFPSSLTLEPSAIVKKIEKGQRVRVIYPQAPIWNGEGTVQKIFDDNTIVVELNRPGFLSRGGFSKDMITILDQPQPTQPTAQPTPVPVPTGSPLPVPTAKPDPFLTLGQNPLQVARNLAVKIAQTNPAQRVNIDAVQFELEKLGISSAILGNAAGQIFKGNQFRNTGETVNSTRPGNRGRRVTIWQYVGQKLAVSTGQFIVERKFFDGWRRSGNATPDGKSLSTHVFTSLEDAQREANRQTQRPGNKGLYRAVPLA